MFSPFICQPIHSGNENRDGYLHASIGRDDIVVTMTQPHFLFGDRGMSVSSLLKGHFYTERIKRLKLLNLLDWVGKKGFDQLTKLIKSKRFDVIEFEDCFFEKSQWVGLVKAVADSQSYLKEFSIKFNSSRENLPLDSKMLFQYLNCLLSLRKLTLRFKYKFNTSSKEKYFFTNKTKKLKEISIITQNSLLHLSRNIRFSGFLQNLSILDLHIPENKGKESCCFFLNCLNKDLFHELKQLNINFNTEYDDDEAELWRLYCLEKYFATYFGNTKVNCKLDLSPYKINNELIYLFSSLEQIPEIKKREMINFSFNCRYSQKMKVSNSFLVCNKGRKLKLLKHEFVE
eukprot:snap_masked-scaffold_7-processed-gene-3.41-mRNA-1 protein AED:1.00 eAED:1.00 QI:0/-1/0/0/-1/1/1/0/343